MTSTFLLLPRPCGSTTVPRTIWSACFGSTPRRAVSSTVSSNFANLTFWSRGIASSIVSGCSGTCFLAASNFLPNVQPPVVQTGQRPSHFYCFVVGPHPHDLYLATFGRSTMLATPFCLVRQFVAVLIPNP